MCFIVPFGNLSSLARSLSCFCLIVLGTAAVLHTKGCKPLICWGWAGLFPSSSAPKLPKRTLPRRPLVSTAQDRARIPGAAGPVHTTPGHQKYVKSRPSTSENSIKGSHLNPRSMTRRSLLALSLFRASRAVAPRACAGSEVMNVVGPASRHNGACKSKVKA